MTKKIAFVLFALLAVGMMTAACTAMDMETLTSTGAMGAKINAAEGQGFTVVNMEWNQYYYLVPPTPPYHHADIRVTMAGETCWTDSNGMTMCEKSLRLITGEVHVMKNGTCKVKNVR